MKLLTFTTLFPNAERPNHGIFVETRLRHLVESGEVESLVVAPVPWFPFKNARLDPYAKFARVPQEEVRSGLKILHPRYPVIPKVGMTIAPYLLAAAAKPTIGRLIDEGYDFDVIDAHYFYPDGVAAVMLGKYFKKPVVVTARGSDITLIPRYRLPRKLIVWAARNAEETITVCQALKSEMKSLGIVGDRITPLRNGVDLQMFRPLDRTQLREHMGLDCFTLLSVGNLVPLKGHDMIIGALPLLPDVRLLIVGTGQERRRLEEHAKILKVLDRVTFLGALPQAQLKDYYSAVDVLVLASKSEGWANVLLESMACGTPVVASNVWGTPEVVTSPDAGVLMKERSVKGLTEAVQSLRESYPDRASTRRYAEQFSWDATTAGQIELFKRVAGRSRAKVTAIHPPEELTGVM
jgi:glycosyltransferase involved in cell wall biosynthesis